MHSINRKGHDHALWGVYVALLMFGMSSCNDATSKMYNEEIPQKESLVVTPTQTYIDHFENAQDDMPANAHILPKI